MVDQTKTATIMRLQPAINECVKVLMLTLLAVEVMIGRRNIINEDVNHLLVFITYCFIKGFQNFSRTKQNPS